MKLAHIYIFFISIFLSSSQLLAQDNEKSTDSISGAYVQRYGLRIGADLSKPIRTLLDNNYNGFELVGDYRFHKRFYIAGEIGTEKKTTADDVLNFDSSGSYIKLGVDYNAYDNWAGMENSIYIGLRYGFSTFKHTLNAYNIYNTDQYWNEQLLLNGPIEFSGLSAHWVEFQLGIKAEVFKNVYVGLNGQIKRLMTEKAPDNFANLYIPGFNKTTEDSSFGVGYGYTISYLIPIYKK